VRLVKLIKEFRFLEEKRSEITLGTNVRLNPDEHLLQLKEDSNDEYPTTADLYAKTWVTNPDSLKQWLGFEAEAVHTTIDGVVVTSLGYRLSDGTDQYWWNTSAWVVDTTNWNTEQEVAANISAFAVTLKKLQVVINLKTTDKTATPKLKRLKVLYSSDVKFQEDIVFRSLIPMLRDNLRPIGRHVLTKLSTSSTIDLKNDHPLETPYNIVGIDAVFNHTDDPDHATDLYSSFNVGTQVITLTGSVAADKVVWVDFLWEPEVAVTTSQDYDEIEKVPVVILDDINLVDASERGPNDSVVNRSDGTAVKIFAPIRGDLDILMHLVTDKAIDQVRLADEVKRFFGNNQFLTSKGLDEEYRLWLTSEYDLTTTANREDLHSGRVRFRVVGVNYFERESADVYAIQRFHLTGDMNVTIP